MEQRSDKNNDIAVLIVENLPSPPPPAIPWGDSDAIQDTQRVFAIGHPRGVLHWAVTDGFISGLQAGKSIPGTAVNRGNSGGPLLNDQGVLVGINQQLVEGSLGIALMSNVIRPLLRGWVPGIRCAGTEADPGYPDPPATTPATTRDREPRLSPEKPPRTPSTSEPAPKATSKEPEKVVRGKDVEGHTCSVSRKAGLMGMGSNNDKRTTKSRCIGYGWTTFYMDSSMK